MYEERASIKSMFSKKNMGVESEVDMGNNDTIAKTAALTRLMYSMHFLLFAK